MDGKRRLLEAGAVAALKKQKLDESEEDDSDVDAGLERFRKAAIWREMNEYKRKEARAQELINTLESTKSKANARLSAVDVSWGQLVAEAQLLLPSTSSLDTGRAAVSPAVSDPSLTTDELEEALQQRSEATKQLLRRLSELHPAERGAGQGAQVEELQSKCRTLIEQSLKSQEALRLLREQHDETAARLESTTTDLVRAEKKFDRLKSSTVAALENVVFPGNGSGARGSATPVPIKASPKSPVPVEVPHPEEPKLDINTEAMLAELEDLRTLVTSRAEEIDGFRHMRVDLTAELDMLRLKLRNIPDDVVAGTVIFGQLQARVQTLAADYEAKRLEMEKAVAESDELRQMQEGFREQVFQDAAEQVDEFQKRLVVREGDLVRIRSQREEFRGELAEVKAKEAERMKSFDELKTLAVSREDRIAAFTSEVRRLKMQLAALQGDGATVDVYASGEEEDVIKDLQGRVKSAEGLLLALRDQLYSYSSTTGTFDQQSIVDSEIAARKELQVCQQRLSKLEALVGPEGNVEMALLVQQVQEKGARVGVLEAQLKSQDHATNMLYGEIDRLSAAWSTLDEQNASKVFNLVGLEEKVGRLTTEKAKADNRYFSTMRQKDAILAENAMLSKLAEKQAKAVVAANELQRSTGFQLTAAEKEITVHEQHVRSHRDKIAELTRENGELGLRNAQSVKHIADINSLLKDRVVQAENESALRKRAEEQVTRGSRELRDAQKRSSLVGPGGVAESSDVEELRRYNADLSKMLKCSTCNLRFKGAIINRCGHLFCKECIEARLSNRARKCPTCQAPFGQADVTAIFF